MASLALRALSKSYSHGLLATAAGVTSAAAWSNGITQCEEPAAAPPPKRASTVRRRMTPIGHFSILSETPQNPSIVTFFIQLRDNGDNTSKPLTKERLTQLWSERQMNVLHPRFHQTACPKWPGYFCDEADGAGDHISESFYPSTDFRNDIRHRLRSLQMTPMNLSESLWHAWVATAPTTTNQNDSSMDDTVDDGKDISSNSSTETLLLFHSHHVLADGASIGAALMDLFDEADQMRNEIRRYFKGRRKQAKTLLERIQRQLRLLYWFIAGTCQALLYQMYCLFATALSDDPWNMVKQAYLKSSSPASGSNNQRTISWVGPVALVDQVKMVAQNIGGPKCTINDVFVSCVTAALARQLALHRRRLFEISRTLDDDDSTTVAKPPLAKQEYMNVTVPVHLKGGIVMPGESVGNSLGAFVARVPAEDMDAESRLRAVHTELNFLKRTPAALVSHVMATTLSYAAYVLPPTFTSWLYRQASAGSVAVVTNVRMSPKATHIDGHRVESAYGFVPLPPGLPVGVVVGSYDGKMYLSVTAEPWAVPDGDDFLQMVLEEYLQLLEKATRT